MTQSNIMRTSFCCARAMGVPRHRTSKATNSRRVLRTNARRYCAMSTFPVLKTTDETFRAYSHLPKVSKRVTLAGGKSIERSAEEPSQLKKIQAFGLLLVPPPVHPCPD